MYSFFLLKLFICYLNVFFYRRYKLVFLTSDLNQIYCVVNIV